MAGPKTKIWLVAQCDEPISGQTVFNQLMRTCLSDCGQIEHLPIGGTTVQKIGRGLLNPLILLARLRSGDIVYTSPPGQMGLWFFLVTVLVLRLRGHPFYAHHHSYRAIAIGPLPQVRLMGKLGAGLITHILLCDKMRDEYENLYRVNDKERFITLPNAAFFSRSGSLSGQERGPRVTVGHMSVMTVEKGVPYLLEMWKHLALNDLDAELVLAGPIPDPELEKQVREAVEQSNGTLKWMGPVAGQAKKDFLEHTELFVLPTQLIDEADPLVLLEAYNFGAAVLAPDRGCIRSRLISTDWLMSMDVEKDATLLLEKVTQVRNERMTLPSLLLEHATALQENAEKSAENFFGEFGVSQDYARDVLKKITAA
ncbi:MULTISPECIES: glycosyltransferase family 4 protein [Pacificibacter]|uniref:glycosyltransferase family 4 protein n=1 Tax=Pacificibacter TaxID=1042323 RepID=UPI001C08C27C|nr:MULTISPECIES: glycosyltransferase family 4 protein [Pacificibacter]MBU2937399.1 glycosyltransferase family 4 protein [Pacificibacter marinus]MDO6617041.1 glycosyltransferase family 4 protein [Pacificibacter sp. 1_MG-2023]